MFFQVFGDYWTTCTYTHLDGVDYTNYNNYKGYIKRTHSGKNPQLRCGHKPNNYS